MGPEWLSDQTWAVISVIILDIWQATPFVLLVVVAAFHQYQKIFKKALQLMEQIGSNIFKDRFTYSSSVAINSIFI